MLVILKTTMLKENREFIFDESESTIDSDLREALEEWVNDLPGTITQATITIDVDDLGNESEETLQRFIDQLNPRRLNNIKDLYNAIGILEWVENNAGASEMAKALNRLINCGMPDEFEDYCENNEDRVFESRAELAEDEYEDRIPSEISDCIDWEKVATENCEYDVIELKGETFYITS